MLRCYRCIVSITSTDLTVLHLQFELFRQSQSPYAEPWWYIFVYFLKHVLLCGLRNAFSSTIHSSVHQKPVDPGGTVADEVAGLFLLLCVRPSSWSHLNMLCSLVVLMFTGWSKDEDIIWMTHCSFQSCQYLCLCSGVDYIPNDSLL